MAEIANNHTSADNVRFGHKKTSNPNQKLIIPAMISKGEAFCSKPLMALLLLYSDFIIVFFVGLCYIRLLCFFSGFSKSITRLSGQNNRITRKNWPCGGTSQLFLFASPGWLV